MAIALKQDTREELIRSIQRYFDEELDEDIGNLAAGGLLAFVLEEIGPHVYNQAVADVQARLQARVADLEFEVHEEPSQYWAKRGRSRSR